MEATLIGVRGVTLTLDEEFARLGIPVLPVAQVAAHKRAAVRAMRQGVWRVLWPVARATVILLLALVPVVQAGIVFGFSAWIGVGSSWLGGDSYVASELFFVAVYSVWLGAASLIILAVALYTERRGWGTNFWRAGTAHWECAEFQKFRREFTGTVPAVIRERASLAENISVRVYVESLDDDPLLVARRGFTKCYIGAWDTGTDLDRM